MDTSSLVSKNEELVSNILKYLLATNYFYTIVDNISGTKFYRHKLKNLLNQIERELDKQQRDESVKEFYKIAEEDMYMKNLEIHIAFFDTLCAMPINEMVDFMVEFINNNYDRLKNGKENS